MMMLRTLPLTHSAALLGVSSRGLWRQGSFRAVMIHA
jgi:hypothetical protein